MRACRTAPASSIHIRRRVRTSASEQHYLRAVNHHHHGHKIASRCVRRFAIRPCAAVAIVSTLYSRPKITCRAACSDSNCVCVLCVCVCCVCVRWCSVTVELATHSRGSRPTLIVHARTHAESTTRRCVSAADRIGRRHHHIAAIGQVGRSHHDHHQHHQRRGGAGAGEQHRNTTATVVVGQQTSRPSAGCRPTAGSALTATPRAECLAGCHRRHQHRNVVVVKGPRSRTTQRRVGVSCSDQRARAFG